MTLSFEDRLLGKTKSPWVSVETVVQKILNNDIIKNPDKMACLVALRTLNSTSYVIKFYNTIYEKVDDILNKFNSLEPIDAAIYYIEEWKNFNFSSSFLCNLMHGMDSISIRDEINENHKEWLESISLVDMSFISVTVPLIWCEKLLKNICQRLNKTVFSQFEKIRIGKPSFLDEGQLHQIVKSYSTLKYKTDIDIYKIYFEDDFLSKTVEFYKNLIDSKSDLDVPELMVHISDWLDKEDRLCRCIYSFSKGDIDELMCNVVLLPHVDKFVEMVPKLSGHEDCLGNMYNLLSRIPDGLMCLQKEIEKYCFMEGCHSVNLISHSVSSDKNFARIYIETGLFPTIIRFFDWLKNYFRNDDNMKKSICNGIRKFINNNSVTKQKDKHSSFYNTSLILADYCDSLLSKNSTVTEDQQYKFMKMIMVIFECLSEKDVFLKLCQIRLKYRFFHEKSASNDSERGFLTELQRNGASSDLLSQMKTMITDFDTSGDLSRNFGQDHVFFPRVLNTFSWKLKFRGGDITLPKAISKRIDDFEAWYSESMNRRVLKWVPEFSTAVIAFNVGPIKEKKIEPRKYTINTTAYCATVLLLFNEQTIINAKEISSITQIDTENLQKILYKLLIGKIIISRPNFNSREGRKQLTEGHKYATNPKFHSEKLRFNLMITSTEQESKVEPGDLGRDQIVDSVLIRIMKSKKSYKMQQLIGDAISDRVLLERFTPTIKQVKRAIERLMAGEYLERSEEDKGKLIYLP